MATKSKTTSKSTTKKQFQAPTLEELVAMEGLQLDFYNYLEKTAGKQIVRMLYAFDYSHMLFKGWQDTPVERITPQGKAAIVRVRGQLAGAKKFLKSQGFEVG